MNLSLLVSLVIIVAALATAGCDQPTQLATVAGVITDAGTGRPVPGASVLSGGRETITNGDGQYALQDLQPGTGTLSVEAEGYASFSTAVVLKGGPQRLDVKLTTEGPEARGRFGYIDKLIEAHQWKMAEDQLLAIIETNREDLDGLLRLGTMLGYTLSPHLPEPSLSGTTQWVDFYLGNLRLANMDDPYAVFFKGKLYEVCALRFVQNRPDSDRWTHDHPGTWSPSHIAVEALTRCIARFDNAMVRSELGQAYYWYSTGDLIAYDQGTANVGITAMSDAARDRLHLLAKEHLDKAIEYDPTNHLNYAVLSSVYMDMKDCESAKAILHTAFEAIPAELMTPHAEEALTDRLAYLAIRERRWEEALNYALRCIELNSKEAVYHAYAGRCYAEIGNDYEAIVCGGGVRVSGQAPIGLKQPLLLAYHLSFCDLHQLPGFQPPLHLTPFPVLSTVFRHPDRVVLVSQRLSCSSLPGRRRSDEDGICDQVHVNQRVYVPPVPI